MPVFSLKVFLKDDFLAQKKNLWFLDPTLHQGNARIFPLNHGEAGPIEFPQFPIGFPTCAKLILRPEGWRGAFFSAKKEGVRN